MSNKPIRQQGPRKEISARKVVPEDKKLLKRTSYLKLYSVGRRDVTKSTNTDSKQ
jgi:hypothetical protein